MANQAVKYLNASANAIAARGMATYYGYTVNTVTATAAIQIRDATAAGAGQVIDTIPIGTAAGVTKTFPFPIRCSIGLVADFNGGTGAITLLYEGQ